MSIPSFFTPESMRPLHFATYRMNQDLYRERGIVGYYKDDRYWSADGADHWSPNEVTRWQYLEEAP